MLPPRFISREEAELLGYQPLSSAIIHELPVHPRDLKKAKSQQEENDSLKKQLAADKMQKDSLKEELAAQNARNAELEKQLALQASTTKGIKDKAQRSDLRPSAGVTASFFAPMARPSAAGDPLPSKKPEDKSQWTGGIKDTSVSAAPTQ